MFNFCFLMSKRSLSATILPLISSIFTLLDIIKKLFEMITKNPKKFVSRKELTVDKFRAISDFISGMTDRYAINLYKDSK